MKKLKKFAARLLSSAVAAVTALSVGVSASAAATVYQWGVYQHSTDGYGWVGNRSTKFSVDDKVHTENSWYSIKLENTDYNLSYIERTYNVEPRTTYKFSAMVKYSDYRLDPNAEAKTSGACVGKAYSYSNSGYTTSNGWTLMEYEFTTGNDETTVNLALQNGIYNGHCKGTAWFSDVKLEKAELTNNWDILAVFFKNADATVSMNGETVHHKMSLRESDINNINSRVLDGLPETFKTLSNNKLKINSIDRYYTDEVLTEKDITPYNYQNGTTIITGGYCVDVSNSTTISKVLDPYLAKKNYNQILIFVPFNGIANGWWGLGGTKYKKVNFAQITNSWDGAFNNASPFLAVHEIFHGLERESRAINGDKTPNLDTERAVYQEKYGLDESQWYGGYMTATLPDGRGLEQSVFYRPNGKYTLVDNDMTTGTGIEPGSSAVAPPAPKNFRAESVSDTHIKLSWEKVANADGYQFINFKDPAYKEKWVSHDYDAKAASGTWGPYTIGKTYYYGIRTVATIDGKTVYSDWTYLTYTHAGTGVIYGDVNNDGSFNIMDVSYALTLLLADSDLDSRTLTAIGISSKANFQITAIHELLTACLSQ